MSPTLADRATRRSLSTWPKPFQRVRRAWKTNQAGSGWKKHYHSQEVDTMP